MIDSKDISVVVQGEIDKEITPKCLQSIRQFLPDSVIVLSTWAGSDISELDYDEIALSEDPGGYPYTSRPGARINNVNRQIRSTLSGLKTAARKYALKLRTDFILKGRSFLGYFSLFPAFDPSYRVFECKILSCVFFARNPRVGEYMFHPSDMAFFGLRTDLLNLFDVPFMTKEDSFFVKREGYLFNRYCPEQHLWVNCLRKNGKNIQFSHVDDISEKNVEDTERYMVSNFIYLDWDEFCLVPPKKLTVFLPPNDHFDIITHLEWKKLYKQYLDSSFFVPEKSSVLLRILNHQVNENHENIKRLFAQTEALHQLQSRLENTETRLNAIFNSKLYRTARKAYRFFRLILRILSNKEDK